MIINSKNMKEFLLDKFELVCLLEGCARGSHLRQHIWRRMVEEWIPLMDDKDLDFTWWVCFRDLWGIFFKDNNAITYGAEQFLQMLASLNRNNYFKITSKDTNKTYNCYKFQGRYYLLGSWDALIDINNTMEIHPTEKLKDNNIPDNLYIYWLDIDIYNKYFPLNG